MTTKKWASDIYHRLIKIRLTEEAIADEYKQQEMRCPVHLSIGQEAVAVGVCAVLEDDDIIFSTHRCHSHYLGKGGNLSSMIAELYGKKSGCSGGLGGSMHLVDESVGMMGSSAIVGGSIPLAVGAALSMKMSDQEGRVAIPFFGDGATEEGVFHESLNFAAKFELPILFVCENNLFSSHLHILERQPKTATSRFAIANDIKVFIEDGNDLVALSKILTTIIPEIRKNNQPIFLEAVTYRHKGHVGHDENIDVGLYRSKDLEKWKKRDPIKRTLEGLSKINQIYVERYHNFKKKLYKDLIDSWKRAMDDPFPNQKQLLNTVYFNEKK